MNYLILCFIISILFFTSCNTAFTVLDVAATTTSIIASNKKYENEQNIEKREKYGNCKQNNNIYNCSNYYTEKEDIVLKEDENLNSEKLLLNVDPIISDKLTESIEKKMVKNGFNIIKSRCYQNECIDNYISNYNLNYIIMIEKLIVENSFFRITGRVIDLESNNSRDFKYQNYSKDISTFGKKFSNYILEYNN